MNAGEGATRDAGCGPETSPDSRVSYDRGLKLQLDGRLAEADRIYRGVLADDPAHAETLSMTARLRLLEGGVEPAERLFLRAGRAAPPSGEVNAGLNRCMHYRRLTDAAADPERPAGLAIRGPFRDTSGYAHMVRSFVRHLAARGLPLYLIDSQLSFVPLLPREYRDPFFERLDEPIRCKALLNFTIPSVVEPVPGFMPVGFSMFEARAMPAAWARYAARIPHLVVPTVSSRDAWISAGIPEDRIHLCPLGVDDVSVENLSPTVVIDGTGRNLASYRTRVLNVSDAIDRKNLDGLLRVWLKATRHDDDAALVLKIGKGHPGENARVVPFIDQVVRRVGKPLGEAAPIFLIQGVLSERSMTELFAACTHYWSMSHGEGWDLPMTQAGALGLSLLAPRHSAYETYLDDDVATFIPARPAPGFAEYDGLEWWNPDETAAADLLARAIADGPRPDRSARAHLLANFGWPKAAERLVGILNDIGAL